MRRKCCLTALTVLAALTLTACGGAEKHINVQDVTQETPAAMQLQETAPVQETAAETETFPELDCCGVVDDGYYAIAAQAQEEAAETQPANEAETIAAPPGCCVPDAAAYEAAPGGCCAE